MPAKVIGVKESGSRPASEGVLAGFAKVHSIRTLGDVEGIARENPDVVLLDLAMPHLEPEEVLRCLRSSVGKKSVILLLDWNESPTQVLGRLVQVGNLRLARQSRVHSIRQLVSLLGVSQELLSRILKVSSRTIHRWLRGSEPKPKGELAKLNRLVSLLDRSFPNKEAIRSYLHHPNPAFGGETPLTLLERGEFEPVEADLLSLQEGVFA